MKNPTLQTYEVLTERISNFLDGDIPKNEKISLLNNEISFYSKDKTLKADLRKQLIQVLRDSRKEVSQILKCF